MNDRPKAIYVMASSPEVVILRRRYPHLASRIFHAHQIWRDLMGVRVDNIWVGPGVYRDHDDLRCRLNPGGRIRRLP
ncbi:MAG: hypothetical protein GY701_22915 [Sulfitobacter sp.]|nr:hypothetical protein [Sulfitobacter sp.]